MSRISLATLRAALGWDEESAWDAWLQKRRSFSAVERERRRVKNREARAARRRNRG